MLILLHFSNQIVGRIMRSYLTFKSGKFYFSEEYDHKLLVLLERVIVLNETIADLPILPEMASQLEPDIMYSSISSTAAIEGNPITEEGVKRIAEGEDIEEYTKKDKQEISNLIKAYGLLNKAEVSEKPIILSENLIRDLHKIVTHRVPHENNIPGNYRNGIVHVGDIAHGGVYTPPKILSDIKNLIKGYINWINSDEIKILSPFIRAALAHYYFCIIHPFWDGNGRTARLLEAIILQAANIRYVPKELSNFYYRNIDEYYHAFSKTIKLKKDFTPFLSFFLKASDRSLTNIKEDIIYLIRKFTLKDYYVYLKNNKVLRKRQLDLLTLLLDYPSYIEFNMKDLFTLSPLSMLYSKVSDQTARRDIAKLADARLIVKNENEKYNLNLRVLG